MAPASGLVSTVLSSAWRRTCSPLSLSSAQLDEVTPLLYESGAAGLGWWRIRDSGLSQTASGELLHQSFRLLTLHGAMHEARIQKVFSLLRSAEVEPILMKGW